ncbi:MAG: tryptophan synthase subunit alpha [Arenimonas sp.]|nr:tryptophan synthase subunit alpha [Arenimonas sp.]
MSRIASLFSRLGASRRKALVPFITAGDPSRDATVAVMHALVANGADLLELGVPFSDPMADGPVIQRSSERALERGIGTSQVFEYVREFRRTDANTPVVLMGYLNPVEIRGADRYAADASQAGIDGLLLVDLPPEEAAPIRASLNAHGLDLISLAAPTTSPERLRRLAEESQGYLYYVSFSGVTGANITDASDVVAKAGALRAMSKVPVLIGFGIKDAASACAMAAIADGIVVGSALVERLATAGSAGEAAERAGTFLAPLRAAIDAPVATDQIG